MNNNLGENDMDIITPEELEMNYRRGVATGFEIAVGMNEESAIKIRRKIQEWRYDYSNKKGVPGTAFENVDFSV